MGCWRVQSLSAQLASITPMKAIIGQRLEGVSITTLQFVIKILLRRFEMFHVIKAYEKMFTSFVCAKHKLKAERSHSSHPFRLKSHISSVLLFVSQIAIICLYTGTRSSARHLFVLQGRRKITGLI